MNTALPVISGTARDGQVLSATTGTWTGSPTISYGYQWRACDAAGSSCADVPGATAATYTLTPGDVGATFRVRVTGTNGAGSDTATSAATALVAPDPPVNTTSPVISGTMTDGETARRRRPDRGRARRSISYAYQWRALRRRRLPAAPTSRAPPTRPTS